ncbi:MAG TPA: TIGR03435 family protein [Bryobacteraceae bacterium]|nr:TIGR03435 family protein [Bryobacteraceae bacterium]
MLFDGGVDSDCAVPGIRSGFRQAQQIRVQRSDQGRLTATNAPLKTLIAQAYGLNGYQVEGPEWLASERFDIAAEFPDGLPTDREKRSETLRSMMKQMLADRFKLAAHRDQKTFPVYGMVVATSGIKFKEKAACGSHDQKQPQQPLRRQMRFYGLPGRISGAAHGPSGG